MYRLNSMRAAPHTPCSVIGIGKEHYTQKRGKGRVQRTEKPCALAAEVSLGDGLEGEADAGADYCKRKYYAPLSPARGKTRSFKYERGGKGVYADKAHLHDTHH